MARRPLADEAIDAIIDRIVDGTFAPDEALPPEADLAALLDVSRPTMREAVRALTDRGVLRVVHGRGTYVAPQDQWRDLPTLIRVLARTMSPSELGQQLTQLRRMLEVGASGLAAEHRDERNLTELQRCLDGYLRAEAAGDLEEVVGWDIAFHEQILRASGNPFLVPVMRALQEALLTSRRSTTADPDVRRRATKHHQALFVAISAGDPTAAKEAMRAHMTQTKNDLLRVTQR